MIVPVNDDNSNLSEQPEFSRTGFRERTGPLQRHFAVSVSDAPTLFPRPFKKSETTEKRLCVMHTF